MSGLAWSVVLALIGLIGTYLTGRYNSWGWFLGLFAQVLWATYAVTTAQYGFLLSAAAFGTIYWRNWRAWRRKDAAAQSVLSAG